MAHVYHRSIRDWRRSQRTALIDKRMAMKPEQRKACNSAIEAALFPLLANSGARIVSLYWPFKGEFNTRNLMQRLHDNGIGVALPDVVTPKAPLVFRPWHPDMPRRRGVYGIPVPDTDEETLPEAVIAPLIGFDSAGYRLGYGGGYYDRTLAKLAPVKLIVGVGFECCRIDTVKPTAHDIPMHVIVTENGLHP